MKLINLTEHTVFLLEAVPEASQTEGSLNPEKATVTLKQWAGCAKADVARVETVTTECAPVFVSDGDAPLLSVPAVSMRLSEVVNLPPAEYGKGYIVSTLVREACKDRHDLFTPYPLHRDTQGRIIGCFGFAVNP